MNNSNSKAGSLLLNPSKSYQSSIIILIFAALSFVGAQIQIPTIPVPTTLQTFVVLLGAAILGSRRATISQIIYITAGCVGLPVFAGFSFGIAKLIGPTGGYLFGFIIASFITGILVQESKKALTIFLAVLAGSLIIFFFGVVQLNFVLLHDWKLSIQQGFLNFAIWDIIKVAAVTFICLELRKKDKSV